jgi:hypothetical protein
MYSEFILIMFYCEAYSFYIFYLTHRSPTVHLYKRTTKKKNVLKKFVTLDMTRYQTPKNPRPGAKTTPEELPQAISPRPKTQFCEENLN